MPAATAKSPLERLRTEPLARVHLAIVTVAVWLAGALYCSGYEVLMSGLDNWPGSLVWSAAAILPWLALFEWTKSKAGRAWTRRWGAVVAALVGTAAASLLLEFTANALAGSSQTPLALALLRRLPAIGVTLLLILWARGASAGEESTDEALATLAGSIDWVAAADNYVELHIGERILMRRMSLREAEKALSGKGFVRIHRRYLVNSRRIDGIAGNGERTVRMRGGAELPVGRRYAANLTASA